MWERKAIAAGDVTFQANALLHDYQFYRSKPKVLTSRQLVVCWKKPSIGWLKINFDGAFSSTDFTGGIGIIVRDDEGNCVGGKFVKVDNVRSLEHVEALAGRCVVHMAQECGFSPVNFETDSMILTQAIRQQSSHDSCLGPIYEDIEDGFSTLPGSLVTHLYRQTNMVADCIAKLFLCNNFASSWGSVPHVFITDVLLKDSNPST